jgi:hypothetical protein
LVPVALRPLEKFKVVLKFALDKLFNWDRPIDTMTCEGV